MPHGCVQLSLHANLPVVDVQASEQTMHGAVTSSHPQLQSIAAAFGATNDTGAAAPMLPVLPVVDAPGFALPPMPAVGGVGPLLKGLGVLAVGHRVERYWEEEGKSCWHPVMPALWLFLLLFSMAWHGVACCQSFSVPISHAHCQACMQAAGGRLSSRLTRRTRESTI